MCVEGRLVNIFALIVMLVYLCFDVFILSWQGMISGSVASKKLFEKEILLTKVVIDAVEAVTAEDNGVLLNKFKLRFLSEGADGRSTTSSGGEKLSTLGSAPPTSSISELRSLQYVKTVPATIFSRVTEKDDFKPLKNELSTLLAPIKDLAKACKDKSTAISTKKQAIANVKTQKFGNLSTPTVPPHFGMFLRCVFV